MVTMPFQNYLIYILFNYICLILDFGKTGTRRVPLNDAIKTIYNQ